MESNQESRLAHKRAFIDFLEQPDGKYVAQLQGLRDAKQNRLVVDLTDLRDFNAELARSLLRQPGEYLDSLTKAVDEVSRAADPKLLKVQQQQLDVNVGFEGPFGFHHVTPRELLSPFLNTLVCVEGIVTKCSLIRPKVVKSVHFCPATSKFEAREYRDVTSLSGLPTGAVYPTKDDNGNLLVTEFGLCKYRDHQTLAIQEMPENLPPGQLPRSIDIIAEDDLVDRCKPGDRVAITGVYKAVPTKATGSMSGTFRTVLVANNLIQLRKDIETPRYSPADIRNIKAVAGRADVWDLLSESLAPSIFGHAWVKKGLLLQLLGGVEKNLPNGTHLRGDVNMLLIGDPSVAKSQLLRVVMHIAPLAVSATGRGSSGVGLTAAVTTDSETGERRLEAGAMVLADRGVVCIDEFDKMSDVDRVAIHEVMEQQTVTIAKAGIHASLNARCSVLAAANPIYGNYDHSLTPTKNIGLPDSLLSRFDLLFIVLDHKDPGVDESIAEHVLRMHRYRPPGDDGTIPTGGESSHLLVSNPGGQGEEDEDEEEREGEGGGVFVKYNRLLHGERRGRRAKREPVTTRFLKKFIHYARARTPKLSDEASEQIAQAYADMRSQNMPDGLKSDSGGTLPVTARTLETVIRLSSAHAKMKLRREIGKADVAAALKLLDFALYHRELNEADKRMEGEERELTAAKKRAEAERARGEGGDGGEGGGSGGVRPKRRRTGAGGTGSQVEGEEEGQGTEEGAREGGSSSGGRTGAMEEDVSMGGGVDGSADGVLPQVDPHRMALFQSLFSAHVMSARLEYITSAELITVVNSRAGGALQGGDQAPFTPEEVHDMLLQMEANNRVMYTRGVVHII